MLALSIALAAVWLLVDLCWRAFGKAAPER